MKLLKIALAASMLAGTFGAAPLLAQNHRDRVIDRHHPTMRHHRRQVCRTEWQHHHKVRRCHWA